MIPVLTIDGPSGVGKGTVANIMAHELKWNLLDSGAIYRAFALAASKRNIKIDNTDELLKLASNLDLKFESDPHPKINSVFILIILKFQLNFELKKLQSLLQNLR